MRRHLLHLALLFALLGCERAHPGTATAQAFVDALKYGDRAGMLAAHIDSTPQSDWCRAEFRGLIERAKAQTTAEDCQRVRALTATDLDAMRDELRLAVQVTGWVCEHPQDDCTSYARLVFEQALQADPLVETPPKSVTIQRVLGDESTAVAYVDLVRADGEVEHLTLQLRNIGDGWRIAGGFLDR